VLCKRECKIFQLKLKSQKRKFPPNPILSLPVRSAIDFSWLPKALVNLEYQVVL